MCLLTLFATSSRQIPLRVTAQPDSADVILERKADFFLKRAWQAYRVNQSDTLTDAQTQRRQVLRAWLRNHIGLEEKGAHVTLGVLVRLTQTEEKQLAQAQAEIEGQGFIIRARLGSVLVTSVELEQLPKLASLSSISQLHAARLSHTLFERETARMKELKPRALRAINDAANAAVRAPEARSSFNVTGRGVVVGVIDSGIDWKHADFRKADGTTRIKALWDLSDTANSGPGGVGRVYTEAEINAALNSQGTVNEKDLNNHGTHVTGTAAGNGLAAGNGVAAGTFAGIAPEADLVIVKGTRSQGNASGFRNDDQIAALQWIAERAAALNEPFVINMSLGGHGGQHDGTDDVETAIDALLAQGAGRQVVIAAGNEGESPIHIGGILGQNVMASLPFTHGPDTRLLLVYYNASDSISAGLTKPDGSTVAPVTFGNSFTDADVEIENAAGNNGTNTRGVAILFKRRVEGNWRLNLRGDKIAQGRVDAWAVDDNGVAFADTVRDGLSHVGSPAVGKNSIAVANYVTKTQFTDVTGAPQTRTDQGMLGAGAASSSTGLTRDGRIKPEIAAPGSYLMSTMSADVMPAVVDRDQALTGKHNVYLGTSMATPVTSGVIALMLQANRNLNSAQIKRILWRTAINDQHTGASISHKFGYGKLNALDAVRAARDNVLAREFVSISAASYASDLVAAPEAILAGFGANLATEVAIGSTVPLPTTLAGVSIRVTDSQGQIRLAPLFFVSPSQINYAIPAGTARGVALIDVLRDGNVIGRGSVNVNNVWPGFFTVNSSGSGVGSANVLRVKADGQQVYEALGESIDVSQPGEKVFLILYGTGWRGRSSEERVQIFLGGLNLPALYSGSVSGLVGLDQINVELPSSLAGRGLLRLVTQVDGWPANTIQFTIK
jgi:uncharacterized protein (TIGR03437 family)